MTDKQIIIDGIDVSGCIYFKMNNKMPMCRACNSGVGSPYCEYHKDCYYKRMMHTGAESNIHKTDKEHAYKRIAELQEQLKAKEQECEKLNKELHKNFEEKDTLHLIIDRLLEASGYDTNTASAENFEDVYEHMRYEQQQLDQLKAENEELRKQIKIIDDETIVVEITEKQFEEYQKLKQALTEIKEIAEYDFKELMNAEDYHNMTEVLKQILQKISEVEDE